MTTSNTFLLDTNILVYAADQSSPFYKDSLLLRERGLKGELSLCICPQTLTEFLPLLRILKGLVNQGLKKRLLVK